MSGLTGAVLQIALGRLGDVDGEIADALEVGVDLDGGDNRPQVGGHRLMQRQQLEAAVVDLDVQVVDRLVADEHVRRPARGHARSEAGDGLAHALFRQPAHREQPLLQRVELLLKVS